MEPWHKERRLKFIRLMMDALYGYQDVLQGEEISMFHKYEMEEKAITDIEKKGIIIEKGEK